MGVIEDNIKKNAESIKNKTYGKNIKAKSDGWVYGAVAGATIGVISAAIFKWSYIKTGVIVGLAGGYIGYKIAEEMNKDLDFTNTKSQTKETSDEKFPKFEVTEV